MSDNMLNKDNEENEKSFAALLDSYGPVASTDIQVGDKVRGQVISAGKDTVFVDTGTKIDGVVDKAEFLDENGQLPFKVGDWLELYVVAVAEDEIRLSKALTGIGGIHLLREAYEKEIPVEGRIKESRKGGFSVEILHRSAFCPVSQIDLKYVENPADYVGETHRFLITQFEDNGQNIILSRRILLAREQEKSRMQFYDTLVVGTVLEGKVTRLMPYGAFVEVSPGVEGMVHVSELSWSKTTAPDTILKPGDSVRVKVLGIEPDAKSNHLKIALSVKQVSEDPWLELPEKYAVGQPAEGIIEKKEKFGYFVNLAPGITGLLPKSKISRTPKPALFEKLREGDTIAVVIEKISLQEKRITLAPADAEHEQNWQKYAKDRQSSLGSLGEKLHQALASKTKPNP